MSQRALRGITWDHPRGYDCLVATSALFERETGISVTWEKRSLQAFADVPIARLAEQFDLIVLDHPHVGQIAEAGCLTALSPMDRATSLGGSVESYIWQGQTWAYAVDAACQMAVRRPDLDAPLLRTWNELESADAGQYRLITPLLPVDAFDMFLTLVASLGEDNLPSGKEAFCSDANGLRALSVLKCLYRLGPGDAVDWNPIRVLEALSTTNDFAASPCLFGYINYAKPDFRPHQLEYVDLPVFASEGKRRAILGGAGIGVSALRGDSTDAIAYATWVTSEDIQAGAYIHGNGQPAHIRAWERNANNPDYSKFLHGGFETISTAWTRPRSPWFLDFVDDVCLIMSDFFTRDQSEEAFLSELNRLYLLHVTKVRA